MSNKSVNYMMMEMEKKLRELMGAEAYTAFAAKIARKAFWREVGGKYALGYNCSQCGKTAIVEYDYCPNCGADMRQGEE